MMNEFSEVFECTPEYLKACLQCRLFSLPTDIMLCCIAPFLRKVDQYKWFSTCKDCKCMLLSARTLRIACKISYNEFSNIYLWERFLKTNRERLFGALGISVQSTNTASNNLRKISLVIPIGELIHHKLVVLTIAKHLSHLIITENEIVNPNEDIRYILPMGFDNPSSQGIERWLKSGWLNIGVDRAPVQLIHSYVEAINAESGERVITVDVDNWNQLRGANKVILKNDRRCFIEVGTNADMCLQDVTFDRCNTLVNLPPVSRITLLHCSNVLNVDSLASSMYVYLEGMTIADLQMLGNVSQLTLKNCKAICYPIPLKIKEHEWKLSIGEFVEIGGKLDNMQTGQHWTFSNLDIADVSKLKMLDTLKLIDCIQVTDISMLGSVRYLTIEGCKKLLLSEQFPHPTGRSKEWTFKSMDMQKVRLNKFGSLNLLSLIQCITKSIDELLSDTVFCNFQGLDLIADSINNINISVTDGKVRLVNNSNLSTAVRLWCNHKTIAKRIYGEIEKWDVSKVNDMSNIFKNCLGFNCNINAWNVRNVTNMGGMFYGATSFNQPLNSWNVSSVTNMSWMFCGASSFNQPLDSWDVRLVTNMNRMFHSTPSFNQALNSWNVGNATDMSYMFGIASSFNQPLDSWDVSSVTDMSYMFGIASSFNQPLDSWDVRMVTSMRIMFYGASSFNQPLNSWNVSSVTNMSWMFCGASSFNQPLDSWDVRMVTSMSIMFYEATSFNQPLDSWDVRMVTSMRIMFSQASSFNQRLDSWNVSNITDMYRMFDAKHNHHQPSWYKQ